MIEEIQADATEYGSFERLKWEAERTFREREIAIKEEELQLKKEEHAISQWHSPLVVAILATAIAAAGNAIVALTNGIFQRQLEAQKSEQARILEMIKTGDSDKAAHNLQFLLESGLIDNRDVHKKLTEFLANRKPGIGPSLPSSSHSLWIEH